MRLDVKIMAHEKRAHFIPALVEQLGITDDDVIWDRHNDRWDTGRRAWEAIDRSADWGCVIQDDALVCSDFIAGMEQALQHVPTACIVSPYVGTRRPAAGKVDRAVKEARARNVSFIEMPSLNWGVAITAPTHIINGMLPWCDRQSYPNYDRRIGRYAIDVLGYPTWCTWPSLVDHRDVPSLIQHGGGRVAHQFLGEDVSALGVDWSKRSVRMGQVFTNAPRRPRAAIIASGSGSYEGKRVARFLRAPRREGFTENTPPQRPGEGSSV